MMFSFKSTARKDLARSLTKAGAPKVSQAVGEIERLVQQYHSRFIAKGVFPDMKFIGEARQLREHADALCCWFDVISPPTRIRLEEERLDRDEKLSLVQYAQSVNDVCIFALHAMGSGDRPIKVHDSASDRALCRLAADIATVWHNYTGAHLPSLPSVNSPAETSWRSMRTLQQHPIWIVYNALDIFVDADAINGLAAEVRRIEQRWDRLCALADRTKRYSICEVEPGLFEVIDDRYLLDHLLQFPELHPRVDDLDIEFDEAVDALSSGPTLNAATERCSAGL
jgi:hypothetical protein